MHCTERGSRSTYVGAPPVAAVATREQNNERRNTGNYACRERRVTRVIRKPGRTEAAVSHTQRTDDPEHMLALAVAFTLVVHAARASTRCVIIVVVDGESPRSASA